MVSVYIRSCLFKPSLCARALCFRYHRQEDSVLFRSENTENTDGSYGFLLHFTINDVDFSQTGDDTIKDYLSDLAWGEFYLYDMNIDDDYTELVVLSGENEADDYVYYSHFFPSLYIIK